VACAHLGLPLVRHVGRAVLLEAHLDFLVLLDDGAAGEAAVGAEVAAGAAVDVVLLADLSTLEAAEASTV
jgi:hypothetical protein